MRAPSRKALVVISLAAFLLAGAGVFLARSEPPAVVGDLEDVDRAGSAAQRETEEIIANLDDIATNLEAGAGMSTYSSRIHRLTDLQRDSLEQLIGVLRGQLVTLGTTRSTLSGAADAAHGVTRTSAAQAADIRASVRMLRELRALVRHAHGTSTELTQDARYAARLAKDSRRRFSR